MSGHLHHYRTTVTWTGNLGTGTSGYKSYSRNHEIAVAGKSSIVEGSSDAAFRGDGSRYNPEEMLVASLSACHMLWLLHLCADAGIVVTEYRDEASGIMETDAAGSGRFREVTLRPHLVITGAERIAEASALSERAHAMCFIANSVNFPVRCEPEVEAR